MELIMASKAQNLHNCFEGVEQVSKLLEATCPFCWPKIPKTPLRGVLKKLDTESLMPTTNS